MTNKTTNPALEAKNTQEAEQERQQQKAQGIAKQISEILEKEGYNLLPVVQIIGGQVQSRVEIVPKPKESKIIQPK